MSHRHILMVGALLIGLTAACQADIFRWDNGQLIPGTGGITPGPGVQLDHRQLRFARLAELDLAGANLASSNLTRASLYRSTLTNANLSGAILVDANLSSATLTGGDLSIAGLTNANLSHA